MLADSPMCVHCGRRTATEADHNPPLSRHVHVPGSDCCVLLPSCFDCARAQGGQLAIGRDPRPKAPKAVEPDPVPLEAFDVGWMSDLLDPPADATWPRLMTAPHPRAVGSLGVEVERASLGRRGVPLRWWQRLVVRRLLEVDAAGHLVWDVTVLTLARQLGKSWVLGDLCGWRLHAAAVLDCPQTVLSTGKDIAVVREVQRPHRLDAKRDRDTYHVREVNGQEEIEVIADGSRWMVRAKEGVYGITATMATVDEAWKVAASVVDDGLEPTTVAVEHDAQIVLVSTAHRRATSLMIGRRARALEHLNDDEGPLLLEWSAPPDAELADRSAWRMASPHWTAKRERLIAKRLEGAIAGESDDVDEPDPLSSFRTQWLNQWPTKRIQAAKGGELVDAEVWATLRGDVADEPTKIYVGVEDHAGFGAAIAAVVVQPDGRYGLDGWTVSTWVDCVADLRRLYAGHDTVKLFVGASLMLRLPPGMRATAATSTLTRATLPLVRELVASGEIVHDSEELDEQIATVRVVEAVGGLMTTTGARSDLLRAASWALAAAAKPTKALSIH